MTFVVREMGSFFVGGRTVRVEGLPPRELRFTPDTPSILSEQSGEFDAFQMYVQYTKLATPVDGPLLLWHGGGCTGSIWERTPDDRPGWQTYFLEAGFDVYVSDAVERGRSSWARHPEVYSSEPVFRSKAEAWKQFRIGPDYATGRTAYPNSQFPVESFDAMTRTLVPRWTTNDQPTLDAYDELLQRVGPGTIVSHSQGGMFALKAAVRSPHLVRAVVAVEPSGFPAASAEELAALRGVPHLFIWGDNVDKHPVWRAAFAGSERYARELRQAGVDCEQLILPDNGIAGNSHFPMFDRNSDRIAQFVHRWLSERLAELYESSGGR